MEENENLEPDEKKIPPEGFDDGDDSYFNEITSDEISAETSEEETKADEESVPSEETAPSEETVPGDEPASVETAEEEPPAEEETMVISREEKELLSAGVQDVVAQENEVLKKEEDESKKVIPRDKLPAIFKGTYSPRSFHRKIIRKIYIPEDRKSVSALFVQGGNPKKPTKLAIPQELMFSKKEVKKFKFIAKEIKKQNKARVRLIPLAVLVGLLVGAVSFVLANKNRIVRNAIKSACEGIFKARTDIDWVDVRILDTSITIGRIQVGNKDSVMKNLFEVQRIQVDFNLVQLLKKRFVAENLEASGIAWNTDRTYSCELPNVPKAESPFVREIKARINNSIEQLKNEAYDLLGGSDIDSIIKTLQDNINTPEVAQEAIAMAQELVEKWKAKPEEMKAEVMRFADSVKELQTINVKMYDIRKASDVAELKSALEKISAAVEQGKVLEAAMKLVVEDVKKDAVSVNDMALKVADTAKSDYDYIVERLTTITGAIANLDGLAMHAADTLVCNLLGKYYPYVMDGLELARELKAKSASKEKKEKPKKVSKRSPGTDFYFTAAYPSFLIQRVKVSGTGFDSSITEITNDQNVRNRPTEAKLALDIKDVHHAGNLMLDFRRATTNPLVTAKYTGTGYKVDVDGSRIATKSGVPSVKGDALISFGATADETGFTAQGYAKLAPVSLSSDGFNNELVTKYYNIGLASVDNLDFGYDVGYTKDRGLYLDLEGNIGEQFVKALVNIALEAGRDAKKAAIAKIQDILNNSENEYLAKAKEFLGIEGDIDLQNMKLADVQKILEKKKLEIEAKLKEEANKKIDEAKAKAEEVIAEKTDAAKAAVKDAVSDVVPDNLKDGLGGLTDQLLDGTSEGAGGLLDGITKKGKGLLGR